MTTTGTVPEGSAWRALVSAAVVGSERRPVPPEVAGAVAAVLEDGSAASATEGPAVDAEERLLVAAGVLGACRRAGAVTPPADAPPPEPAPGDDRPAPPPRAVQLLDLLLDGRATPRATGTDLVAHWLTRCAASGHRLPAVMLPRVLEAATAAPALRGPALAAGGPRLRWLAAANPAWGWAAASAGTGADPEQVWAEGTRAERLALLTSLRERGPARARNLLAGSWASEAAADRARFVEALATGLSGNDEPFLEAALDDRAGTVRTAAAELLAALPESALAQRMAERLRPLVRVETPAGGIARRRRAQLRVALPGVVGADAIRDGIATEGGPRGVSRHAWALTQIVAAAPLRFWEDALEAPPGGCVTLGADHPEVLAGWVRAAARQGDVVWARQLLRLRADPGLLAVLPPRDASDELPALLDRVDDPAIVPLLAAAPPPWPPATGSAVIERLRGARQRQAVGSALPVLATALDPAVAPEVERWAGALRADDPVRGLLRDLVQTLSFRRAIAEELG